MNTPASGRRSGSALILVIWVTSLLAVLVGALAFDAHVEARLTSYYRKRTRADALARSGMQIADVLMRKSARIPPHSEAADDSDDPWFADAKRLSDGSTVTLERELGDGTVSLTIVTEEARRNVNLLDTYPEWEAVLEVGDIPEEFWPELIDSFLDWIDADDTERSDGAETDYYMGNQVAAPGVLPGVGEGPRQGYRAKNGPLFTVDELRLVKGFADHPAVLTGGELRRKTDPADSPGVIVSGIADLLTTFGDDKINVNAASERVLMTLPDIGGDIDEVVARILAQRAGEENAEGVREPDYFRSDQDVLARVPGLSRPSLSGYVTTRSSRYFRVTSVGSVRGVRRKTWAIVRHDGRESTILQWREGD